MTFNSLEEAACRRLVEWALREDLDTVGDLTSQAVIPAERQGRAAFTARSAGVIAGLPAVAIVMQAVAADLALQQLVDDSAIVKAGERLAVVSGPMRAMLSAERTALNFLQHLSGIATRTRRYVDAIAGLSAHILDTRKTTPGWRLLEKYAVRAGGGQNHRLGLYDGILIKDNHLASVAAGAGSIARAVAAARSSARPGLPIEIEVDNLEQLEEALACRPDIVLLDNMQPTQIREAVRRRQALAPQVLLEASGGITLANVRAIAECGVDRISVGELTHSAPALDIALDYFPA
jgi:nicotinate-nucleotide pyrophosphorylase (carboxylating)